MTLHRINWQSAASTGARVGRAILIAGLPWAIVPEGQEITAVTWTGDSDPAWHAGMSPTCKAWLLAHSEHDTSVPALAWEENASPVQGTVDVGSLRFWLAAPDDGPTLTLGARDAQVFTRLVGDHSASTTTITVESTAAFGASGVLHLGRERITYTAKAGATFTGCVRGTAGTDARRYVASSGALFRVYEAGTDERLPTLTGRRCTVWLFTLGDTGEATNPTLVYDGRIASGAGTVESSAWEIAVEHAIHALDAESQAPTLSLYGYAHGNTRRNLIVSSTSTGAFVPLLAYWRGASTTRELTLNRDAADPDRGGWSESREQYLERWNRAGEAGGYGIAASLRADGILQVSARDGVTDRRLITWHGWNESQTFDPADPDRFRETATTFSTGGPMPRACLWMTGEMPLPPGELAKIPPTPTFPLSDATAANWTLTAECAGGELVAAIRDPANGGADPIISGFGVKLTGVTEQPEEAPVNPALITKPTTAKLGLVARGERWWSTLRYAVLDQMDVLRGADQLSDSIDWGRLEALGRRAAAHPTRREYVVDIEEPFLGILRNEAALNGLALSTWHGRVSMTQIREAAPTEARSGALTTGHLREDEVATVREVTDGLATSYKLNLPAPSEDTITVNDAGAIAESGAGETIEATMPRGVLPDGSDVATPSLQRTVIEVAAALLAPWVRPYQVVSWPGDLRLAGHQIGDVVTLSEWLLPDQQGGRGLDGIVGTVLGRRVDFDTGTVDLRLRLSPSTVAGYAPSALVSSITGAAVTLDTATVATCGFADPYQDDGSARTDGGASYFVTGDKVLLIEVDSESPTTPFVGEVLSVAGAVVTLTSSPGSTWETLAGDPLKVMLVPDDWSTSTAGQRRYAYVADAATFQLPSSTQGRRWT